MSSPTIWRHTSYILSGHAKATPSKVSLFRTSEAWHLDVHDDGMGFDTENQDGYGCGLRNMAARADKLDAKFQLLSQCGNGTRVTLDIPRGKHVCP